jgi:hypothetical protein
MTDIFQRLQSALPRVEVWIDRLLEQNAASASRLDLLRFARLSLYWPKDLLQKVRVVLASPVPFPPVSQYGLPEFAAIMGNISGITFRDMFFIDLAAEASEATHFHELVHVVQWNALGPSDFLLTYAAGLMQFRYENSPLERMAYDLQGKFERGEPIPCITDTIERHAFQARSDAAEILRRYGASSSEGFTS